MTTSAWAKSARFGVGVFAQRGVNAQQLQARHGAQAFADLQAGGAGFAVDKNLFHGKNGL
jgi:anaerobic glycerol-3-phosphate dehydrogenase